MLARSRAVVVLSALTLTLFACSDDSPAASGASSANDGNQSTGPGDGEDQGQDQDQGQGDGEDQGQDQDQGQGDADEPQGGQNTESLLIGRWLGPEPGMNQEQCANGTTEYTFESDGTWVGRNVNIDECGGTFTIGGTYAVSDDGTTVTFHFTNCPEGCSQFPDAPVSISFVGDDGFTFSDSSFTGTYYRQ